MKLLRYAVLAGLAIVNVLGATSASAQDRGEPLAQYDYVCGDIVGAQGRIACGFAVDQNETTPAINAFAIGSSIEQLEKPAATAVATSIQTGTGVQVVAKVKIYANNKYVVYVYDDCIIVINRKTGGLVAIFE